MPFHSSLVDCGEIMQIRRWGTEDRSDAYAGEKKYRALIGWMSAGKIPGCRDFRGRPTTYSTTSALLVYSSHIASAFRMGGRHDFGPQRVHKAVTQLLQIGRISEVPPWYHKMELFPPTERLTRPALQAHRSKNRKRSTMYKPMRISYEEDGLRETFFGDHPWELARPRVVLENDGKDYQRQDWSHMEAPGRQLSGES